jgi:hypothetical protein
MKLAKHVYRFDECEEVLLKLRLYQHTAVRNFNCLTHFSTRNAGFWKGRSRQIRASFQGTLLHIDVPARGYTRFQDKELNEA